MIRFFRRAAVVALLALTGCATEYTYAPPATAEGKACVAQCQVTQGSCRNVQLHNAAGAKQQCDNDSVYELQACQASAEPEFAQCQYEAQQDYTACLRYSDKREACRPKQCYRKDCYKRSCPLSPDYGFCDTEYRACYQNCGGTVGIMK